MKKSFLLALTFILFGSMIGFGQNPVASSQYIPDPMNNVVDELVKISRSVTSLTTQMKIFVDKFEKVGGITFNEKQQKLILAMEMLQKAEARFTGLQKAQIELVEKLNETRSKLAQNEIDSRPRNIDRSFALAGTTELVELRENKVAKLQAERVSLTMLTQQIQSNLADTTEAVREAQVMVNRLRKLYLPQIEKELFEQ